MSLMCVLMKDLDTRGDFEISIAGNIIRVPIRNSTHRIAIHQALIDRLRPTSTRKERNADRPSS
jgi:hypothetical protein